MKKDRIIWERRLPSTNHVLLEKASDYSGGTVLATKEQFSGVGLGSNIWASAPGANLTFSYLFKPEQKLEASQQYLINIAVAVALLEYLSPQTDKRVYIKWPNDLLVEQKKICGILIQHILWSTQIHASVIGIGLNINQTTFPEFTPQATSLRLLTGQRFNIQKELERLTKLLDQKFELLFSGNTEELKNIFLSNLFRYKQWANYIIRGVERKAKITGIDNFGFLKLEDIEGENYVCDLKEVVYLY